MSGTDARAAAIADAIRWSTAEDEQHRVTTTDGWHLALYRYRPRGADRRHPVLVGHGLCGSHWLFDLHDDCSLARALAAAGFDVWLLDLRGRGASWPDAGPDEALQWTFDDFVDHDIPAALGYVATTADVAAVSWIGTEMSGIATYALAQTPARERLRGAITMGAPAITPPSAEVPGVTTPFPERDGTRYRFSMVRDVGPILAYERSEHLESSFRPSNTDWVVTARYFAHGVPDESSAIIDQFRSWMESGTMQRVDRSEVWSDHLDAIDLPILVMAAAADRQRPADAVRATFEALGSPDKELEIAGLASGWPVDPGHDDLIAGLASPAHTFPRVIDWLARH